MKIYAVCFFKYDDNHESAYSYYRKYEDAKKDLKRKAEMYKNYMKNLITWDASENGFNIDMSVFYQSNTYVDKYDRWFISEIEVA